MRQRDKVNRQRQEDKIETNENTKNNMKRNGLMEKLEKYHLSNSTEIRITEINKKEKMSNAEHSYKNM